MNTYLLFLLSEIRKDKMKLIKDPIKRMSYNGSGSAREVVRMIALALGFKIHEDEYGISAYGGNAIRIADHCTYMQTWVDRGTWNAPIRLDVVIEEEPTQVVTQVKKGYDFTIVEFVYNITDVDTQNARTIAYDIRNVINGNQYANNARGERRALKSTHNSNENKQYNKKRNMKRTIRLTESELKNMITESVKRVLCEGYTQGDINNAFQQWQQQGLQQIRNGYQNQQVRQNGGYNSLGHENAAYNASLLMSKANYLYQYLMKNDFQSASQMLQPISDLLETIEADLQSHQRDQQYRNSMYQM